MSINVSLSLNTFLTGHAFFALGWLGFFGIIESGSLLFCPTLSGSLALSLSLTPDLLGLERRS